MAQRQYIERHGPHLQAAQMERHPGGRFAALHWLIEMSDDLLKATVGSSGRIRKEGFPAFAEPVRDFGEELGEWAIYIPLALLALIQQQLPRGDHSARFRITVAVRVPGNAIERRAAGDSPAFGTEKIATTSSGPLVAKEVSSATL